LGIESVGYRCTWQLEAHFSPDLTYPSNRNTDDKKGDENMALIRKGEHEKGEFCVVGILLVLLFTFPLRAAGVLTQESPVGKLIRLAGNANDDRTSLAYLRQLQKQPNLNEQLKVDLGKLIAEIDRWINSRRLDYFSREVSRKKDWDFKIASDSPLYPLTYLYRARMLIWYTLESGGTWNHPERRAEFLGKARRFLEASKEDFPESKTVRMYLGEPIASNRRYSPVPGAPEWAVYQREGLERLADIIEWWIDNRMQENGEYGGGWGDDCEMWRWWVPVLIGFDDPKITRAQTRFSNALLSQPHLKPGYMTRMTDVEHSAEDSSDAMTPMMHLGPDNELWQNRAYRLAELMETLWTGRNHRGFLQFKSTYFSVSEVDSRPARACDTVYHPRAAQPALLYWQRTGDETLGKLFTAWMDTWVDAAVRAERGKPAGVIPSAIHWPDGVIGGVGRDWWDPRNHSETTLYEWPSAMGMMTNTLLLTYYMTKNPEYLDPIRSMAMIRLKYLNRPPEEPPAAGTEAWCASKVSMSGVIAKYKFLTGGTEFDELLARESTPYVAFRLHGDKGALVEALRENAEALSINFGGYTREVRYTDRVLRFPSLFRKGVMFDDGIAAIRSPNPGLLYSTATGDPGGAGYFPLNAVRWLTPPRGIAALVTESGRDRFTAELFHFGRQQRQIVAELYLLRPGKYTSELLPYEAEDKEGKMKGDFAVRGLSTRISFTLPPRKLCVLRVRRMNPEIRHDADSRAATGGTRRCQ